MTLVVIIAGNSCIPALPCTKCMILNRNLLQTHFLDCIIRYKKNATDVNRSKYM
jgi:hypothetical protein